MANPTIGATTPRIQYTATASQTVFTVPFEFLANADLAVYVNGTLKTLTTDYTLTGANTTGGGSLTFVTGRTAGDIVTILGNLAYSRNTNKYTKFGLLPAEVLEADFDALQVQAKQLALADQFAIRAPLTDTGSPAMTLPVKATRASKALGFDANGNPTVSTSSLADIDSTVQIIDTLNALPAGSSANVSYLPAGVGAVISTVQTKLRETVSVKDFGAVGNGSTDDTTAIQKAINEVVSRGSGMIYFPPGIYKTTSALTITNAKGIGMFGDGSDRTMIDAVNGNVAVQCNGLWRSVFKGLTFRTSGTALVNKATFELDGNYDGVNTQGVQGNIFMECAFQGSGIATYAFAVCRQGGASGQGSENIWIGCTWYGATEACFLVNGFNALNNTIVGGNFQSYSKHGAANYAGSVAFYSVGFQSTTSYTQILNNGYDIFTGTTGAKEPIVVSGCRTESLRFFYGSQTQPPVIFGNVQLPALNSSWQANSARALNYAINKNAPSGTAKLYVATTGGTTGAVEPTWPETGTVADGSVVWTVTEFDVVRIDNLSSGRPVTAFTDLRTNSFTLGNVNARTKNDKACVEIIGPTTYAAKQGDEIILVDASAGAVTITPYFASPTTPSAYPVGHEVTVSKVDTSINAVTVTSVGVIPGGGKGFVTFALSGGSFSTGYYVTSSSNHLGPSGSATYDPANLLDGAGATTTVTVTGARLGDYAEASFSLDLQGITVTAWVSANDTVSVRFQNETGGAIDLASGTLRARVRKP